MKKEEKEHIREALVAYIGRFKSQNEAARSLTGVSEGTISQIVNSNWELISEEMWRKVSGQVAGEAGTWQHVETHNFKKITALLGDAHAHRQVCAITGDGGVGKTHAFRHYAATHRHVIWLRCEKYWTQKYMLQELLRGIGFQAKGMTIVEMMDEIKERIRKRGHVLIIFDQFNKLRDNVKDFMIPLYNELEDECGFFISGTNHLKTSFRRGVRLDKEGYQEMFSRMGRKFIEIRKPSMRDVTAICMSNGIDVKSHVREIWEDCEEDLRRVKRKIHGLTAFNQHKTAA